MRGKLAGEASIVEVNLGLVLIAADGGLDWQYIQAR